MTVQELIEIEKKYKEDHKDDPWVYNEVGELEPANMNDDIVFLEKGYIARHNSIKPETRKDLTDKGLNNFEMLMLMCFVGYLSYAFRWNSYNDKKRPIPEMCEGLDVVLEKSPVYDEGNVLYRFCTSDDKVNFKEGEIFRAPHYVTTTKSNWEKDTDVYVITPKSIGTNARSIYKLYNKANENQVTFKRGTSFKITKIEKGKYKKIYMEEN